MPTVLLERPHKVLLVVLLLVSCFTISSISCLSHQANLRNNNPQVTKFYELKFQNQLDNSTSVKQEYQQQIFKCQVRLAPVSLQSSAASTTTRPKFKSSFTFIQANQTASQQYPPTISPATRPLIWNLTIDWIKDDQLIGGPLLSGDAGNNQSVAEAIAVINVELKSNTNTSSTSTSAGTIIATNGNGAPKNDKRMAASKTRRIEIKNTLNGNQMKLTSRLRLAQLRGSDSGQYKCIARASFQMPASVAVSSDIQGVVGIGYPAYQQPNDSGHPSLALNQPMSTSQFIPLVQIEQSLESNEPNLIVVANTTDGRGAEQEGGTKEIGMSGGGDSRSSGHGSGSASGSQKALLEPDGRRRQHRQQLLLSFQQRETTAGQNNPDSSGLWQDIHHQHKFKHDANDTQHATTTKQAQIASEHHLEGDRNLTTTTTTTTATNSSLPLGSSGSVAAAAAMTEAQLEAARSIELGGRDDNEHNGGLVWSPSSGRSNLSSSQLRKQQAMSQSEDDEDLFKMEQERIEFISGQGRRTTAASKTGGAPAATGPSNDDRDGEAQREGSQPTGGAHEKQQQHDRHQSSVQANNGVSIMSSGDERWNGPPSVEVAADNEDDLEGNNESSLASPSSNNQFNKNDRSSAIGADGNSKRGHMSFMGDEATNYDGGGRLGEEEEEEEEKGRGRESPPASVFTMNHYFSGSQLDSTRMRLVKLVHRITPELSCYTGSGEHYRGNVSASADKRTCMSWALIRSFGGGGGGGGSNNNDHNHCRNPNRDPRGPWCFVQYMESLDGLYEMSGNPIQPTPDNHVGRRKDNMVNGNLILSGAQARYVSRPCSISPCSEFLWLYIVAPPLGLLVILSCLVTMLVRSIRRSHYQAMISIKRHTMPKFNGLPWARSKFAGGRKFGGARSKGSNYLDEDIFEIVDDLDWSDGNQTHQSLSPKSHNTESLKLDSSFSSSSGSDAESPHQRLPGCKSTNPIFCGHDKTIDRTTSSDLLGEPCIGNKSVSQVGPMFATLRCHIRATSDKSKSGLAAAAATSNQSTVGGRQLFCNIRANGRKFTEQPDLTIGSGRKRRDQSITSSSSFADCDRATANQQQNNKHQTNGLGHLISCSTTASSIADSGGCLDSPTLDCGSICVGFNEQKYIKGSELPQLSASCIIGYNSTTTDETGDQQMQQQQQQQQQQQPLFEGKFSQVILAYIRKHELNDGKAPASNEGDMSSMIHRPPSARLHQVAICSLKPGATIDSSVLKPSNLKLHNLNHLNLIKLIGYAPLDMNEIGLKNGGNYSQIMHTLVYDMAQMVDLSDWLKQQDKEMMVAIQEPGSDLTIRRNLTCFAKQLALAIDYLHNQGITYKDLACRNCFLNPTKMLVKLATFNIELANNDSVMEGAIGGGGGEAGSSKDTEKQALQNLHLGSMIRPKYLLDYYVIDSRPADCQLLPLSWIPLESILFNKFNKQTDVWSFGCLLYELFSLGKVAYFGYSSKQIIDAVRSNLMPPKSLLCPDGIYKLMCKCLSDIPTIRPNIKQIYEQLNLFSGQCSSFLDHHLCTLATTMYDDQQRMQSNYDCGQLIELKSDQSTSCNVDNNSITKTKSYANIRNLNSPVANRSQELRLADYNNPRPVFVQQNTRTEAGKIPLSKSINLAGDGAGRFISGGFISGAAHVEFTGRDHGSINHYDEPVVVGVKKFVGQDL